MSKNDPLKTQIRIYEFTLDDIHAALQLKKEEKITDIRKESREDKEFVVVDTVEGEVKDQVKRSSAGYQKS